MAPAGTDEQQLARVAHMPVAEPPPLLLLLPLAPASSAHSLAQVVARAFW
jgi:hypothetical protein